jgi:para-aminobenzoate synthetase component 1
MATMEAIRARKLMNDMGRDKRPFFFIVDFEMEKPVIWPLDAIPAYIVADIPLFSNVAGEVVIRKGLYDPPGDVLPGFASPVAVLPGSAAAETVRQGAGSSETVMPGSATLEATPVAWEKYLVAYKKVLKGLNRGDSYLVNLTFPTLLGGQPDLESIFYASRARYRLLWRDRFVLFSPEIFIRTEGNTISSFPMKGTIDASVPDAERKILEDRKEEAEHNTIVDLIRNDLSMVGEDVFVRRYRYIDRIRTSDRELLQVSSEISARLPDDWREHPGDIIMPLLPAGSVSGAPKKETLRIIGDSEMSPRGWFTGVFGVFDGERIDSGVMIRYIEHNGNSYVYRSGGGITALSDPHKEYNELISKVYVPVG